MKQVTASVAQPMTAPTAPDGSWRPVTIMASGERGSSSLPQRAFIALGANLGNAVATVKQALADLDAMPQSRVAACSSLYQSAPVDAEGPAFINAVAALDTRLSPEALLRQLQRLEARAGRERPYRHAPRTLDLDLLLHADAVIDSPLLTLPHPRMRERAFVLLPLAEIAPELVGAHHLAGVAWQSIARLPGSTFTGTSCGPLRSDARSSAGS